MRKANYGSSTPFLKWAGGKRWFCDAVDRFLPVEFNRYFEPFLGGAALFFHLAPPEATLSDINEELINAYIQVRDNLTKVTTQLRRLRINKRTYCDVRRNVPRKAVDRAVRFIYLNKTAFNGLYRVNKKGDFNVPFAGNQGRSIFDETEILAASQRLTGCTIINQDFEESFSQARSGDLIYCDPPYTVYHNNNGFIRYNEALFSWHDQRRLASAARKAVYRGVHVLVSNAQHESVRTLYRGFEVYPQLRSSCMAADPAKRCQTSEDLFVGDPKRV